MGAAATAASSALGSRRTNDDDVVVVLVLVFGELLHGKLLSSGCGCCGGNECVFSGKRRKLDGPLANLGNL